MNAGSRYVILSSFNPDICLALRLKQNHFPVLFISRGYLVTSNDRTSRLDPRHYSLKSAINWAHLMNLDGIVTVGEYFGSMTPVGCENTASQYSQMMEIRKLACFVYGKGVSDVTFLDKAAQFGLTGVIIDRVEEYMENYKSSTYSKIPQYIDGFK